MKQKIARITDILRRDDGISGAMHYTEQISWILFLKFLDDYEQRESDNALLDGKVYKYLLEEKYRWKNWINLQNGRITGDDLKDFVNKELFPYLKSFRNINEDYHSIKYKVGEIFHFIDNRIESGHTLREIVDIIDNLNFQKQEDLFELSHIYESLLQGMGNDGGNSGEFYTPRSIIKIMVDSVDPKIGQTIYDPATGSCGFLIEAFNHINLQDKTDKQLEFLKKETFFGNEKTGLAYIMGVMNMILHGISNPNINKKNTLTQDIRQVQEKDRFDIILANPPFGGKEKDMIQQNFPIKTNATEMLFLQHIMKNLKLGGKSSIIVPEGVLFNTGNAFQDIKKELLENFNLHSIISLPAGVFLPYSGVKTNVIFFDREGKTSDIWYYEIDLGRTLTKNKPITYDDIKHIPEMLKKREVGQNSWIVKIEDIKDYDLSAKNPNKVKEESLRTPKEIFEEIQNNDKEINNLIGELKEILR
ncbi:MAG: N-6 DNA methylase [Candidatus Gracilibacteria bacterium]|nr:N-6 DNA methylase [Candidatus Gracilibacteria bacterium]